VASIARVTAARANNHYGVIGVARDANEDDIKRVYRKLVIQVHPDKGGDGEAFRKVNEAYEALMRQFQGGSRGGKRSRRRR
jgi:DnaJ-class molecular chaperone